MKKVFVFICLAVFFAAGIWGAFNMLSFPRTISSEMDAVSLYNNPNKYDLSDATGVADIIVREDLDKTRSVNSVTAIVFDFRGYDTMGESFILLTAISGSMAVLRKSHSNELGGVDHDEKKR